MSPYWVASDRVSSLAIVPRPRGGDWLEDELLFLRREGIDVLVSLLTAQEQAELELNLEALACEKAGLLYLNFPIPDRQVPSSSKSFASFLGRIRTELESGKRIGVHCRGGIGRSSLLIAAVLCSEGLSATDAFGLISQARGLSVPDTPEQAEWVATFSQGTLLR